MEKPESLCSLDASRGFIMVTLVARALDSLSRDPKLAIDTAARMPHFLVHRRSVMWQLTVKYLDRSKYGFDIPVKPPHQGRKSSAALDGRRERDWMDSVTTMRLPGFPDLR